MWMQSGATREREGRWQKSRGVIMLLWEAERGMVLQFGWLVVVCAWVNVVEGKGRLQS